jgi:hypothetical protein
MNYAHVVYGIQMASAARAWMYRQPQEDWEKVKCDTMLPTIMKTLMTMDFLREMNHYSHQMC